MRISDWSSDVCSSDLTVAAFVTGEKPSVCCRNLRAGAEEGAFAAQLREHRGAVVDKGAGVLRAGFGRQTFELLAAGKVRRLLQPLQQAEGQRAEDVEADLAVGLAGQQQQGRVGRLLLLLVVGAADRTRVVRGKGGSVGV